MKYFQQVSIKVSSILEKRRIAIFIEGLKDPSKGLVKDFNRTNIQDTVRKDITLESYFRKSSKRVYQPPYKRRTVMDQMRKPNEKTLCKFEIAKCIESYRQDMKRASF